MNRPVLLSHGVIAATGQRVISKLSKRLVCIFLLALVLLSAGEAGAASCVWRVTAPDGKMLYLGGSVHALRPTDYPLPAAYNRAFDAATHIVFEVDAAGLNNSAKALAKAGEYPKGDSLKAHVDPRTYEYLRRLFGLLKVPEQEFSRYRPWFIVLKLQSGAGTGVSSELGVDQYLMKRAVTRSKPVSGLETAGEHALVYSGLSDRQGEALLLMSFIPSAAGGNDNERIMSAWRRGDADTLAQIMQNSFSEFPSFGSRVLAERNRAWIPKIENDLRSNRTYFIVAGAGHFGGPNGVLALLRSRGYKIEQL